MGRIEGSAVKEREERTSAALPGYERLEGGALPVVHPPGLEERAGELLATSLGPGGREWLLSRPEF